MSFSRVRCYVLMSLASKKPLPLSVGMPLISCLIFRNLFRLPVEEKLDGHCECTLWSPHEKAHEWGTLYCSPNYLCFSSKVRQRA